jgi:membrane peptidoglycan carboxypeptidase
MRHRAWAVGLLIVALGGAGVVAWPRPEVGTLPARVRARIAAHGGRYIPLARVPRALQEAVVAAEDDTFYDNPGVDVVALGRAALADLRAGRIVQGGSTLTEQLADVVLVHGDRSPLRRLVTMADALHIARRFSKAQILEMYLNAVYFGEGAYGVGQAARVYFHRPVQALDLGRSALLAGLPRGPSAYDPLCHPRAARGRLREVLAAMVRTRAISRGAAAVAARELAAWLAARPPGRPLPGAGRPGRSCAMPRGPVRLGEALPRTTPPA